MKSLFTRKSLAVVSALFVASIVTSCHDEEVANIEELSYRHGYEYNFVKTFGEIDHNQSWDFTWYARRKMNYVMTRAGETTVESFGLPLVTDPDYPGRQFYEIPKDIHSWIVGNVMEDNGMSQQSHGRLKDELWHAFSFQATASDAFDLLPFYLGKPDCNYDFGMVIVDPVTKQAVYNGDYSKPLWHLTDTGIQWHSNGESSGWHDIDGSTSGGQGSTIEAAQTRAEPILIDFSDPKYNLDSSQPDKIYTVYFYINILKRHPNYNNTGDKLTSITHQPNMVAIDLPPTIDKLTNSDGYNAMVIGVETGNQNVMLTNNHVEGQGRADFDYQDLMFLLVGRIPTIRYDECLQKQVINKRYLIEDLVGYDFDFNDIIVDATDTSIRYFIIDESNGIVTEPEDGTTYNNIHYPLYSQQAKLRWLCGTLPFQVTIGNYTFKRVTDPTDLTQTQKQLNGETTENKVTIIGKYDTGINPEFVTDITGWDPDKNNISATIWTQRKLEGSTDDSSNLDGPWVWRSEFPSVGTVPYIIAVDPLDKYIQPELEHIPTTWLGGDMSTDTYTVDIEVIPINN